MSPEEYLAQERRAERKSEYIQGETFAMSVASRRHVLMVTNLIANLLPRLEGNPCELYSNDMRLSAGPAGVYTYPDLMVVCGEPKFAVEQKDTLLNPMLIIEVLSESTRDYDTGRKFQYYRALPSLMEYLTVEQDEPRVAYWSRGRNEQWDVVELTDLSQTVQLSSITCSLPLTAIYKTLDWPDASSH
jgi:Uma2 family endonuclease